MLHGMPWSFVFMKTAAIICEYNPFHYGHLYHIEETKRILGEDTVIVSLMSGNFVQRGLPAYEDKWKRAEQAVKKGSDLVIELPFAYACNGASRFAEGAVKLLDKMNCIDYLSFGSEAGDIDVLKDQMHISEEMIKDATGGMTYARAMGQSQIMKTPNNILSVEYLRQLERQGSSIIPMTVKRGDFRSSSYIRQKASEGECIDEYMPLPYEGFTGQIPYELVAYAALDRTAEEIDALPSAGEGIGFKIKEQIRLCSSVKELVDAVRQSRYTVARINRVICQMLAGSEESECIRILAVGKRGSEVIRKMKKDGVNPVTNINRQPGYSMTDIKASDVYNLIRGRDLYSESDYVKKPYIAIENTKL